MLVSVSGPALSQVDPLNVIEVRVTGNQRLSDEAVLIYIRTLPGEAYDAQLITDDVDNILESGRFVSAKASAARTDSGMIVTFNVVELPLIRSISFEGNEKITDKILARDLAFGESDPLNRFYIETGRQTITSLYLDAGHYAVEVSIDEAALNNNDVIYRIVESQRVYLRKMKFQGNDSFGHFKLGLKVKSGAGFWLMGLPVIPGKLSAEKIQGDLKILKDFYVGQGFLEAKVSHVLDFSEDKKKASLTYVIDEGLHYRINEVIFEGNTLFTDDELARRIILATGKFCELESRKFDRKTLSDTYGELGYIDADVDERIRYRSEMGLVDIIFSIREGIQYHVGKVVVRGNNNTQDRVVRNRIFVFPDQLYNTAAIEESRSRLRDTGLFEMVEITPVGSLGNVRDVLVELDEALTSKFMVGLGVSTRDGLVGNISLSQSNFDILGWPRSWDDVLQNRSFRGAGQNFSLNAKPGTELSEFSVDWFEPHLLDSPYALGMKTFWHTRERDDYKESRIGEVFSLGRNFPNRWYVEFSGRAEGINLHDLDDDVPSEVKDDEGKHFIVGTKGTLVRDRTDSRWAPTTGDRFRLSYEQVMGDFNFGRIRTSYKRHHTMYIDQLGRKHVLSWRVSAGQIFGNAPVFEKFYAGGIGSVRGFKYRGISPRSADAGNDDPIGGDTIFLASTEYSFPIAGAARKSQLDGVFFLDTGTVENDFEFSTYRVSIGFGIRWMISALGSLPVSLDFGIPLTRGDDDDTELASFSLGMSF